jgi:hypothetical protein
MLERKTIWLLTGWRSKMPLQMHCLLGLECEPFPRARARGPIEALTSSETRLSDVPFPRARARGPIEAENRL